MLTQMVSKVPLHLFFQNVSLRQRILAIYFWLSHTPSSLFIVKESQMNLGGKQSSISNYRGLPLQDMSSFPCLAAWVGMNDLGSGLNPERKAQR